MAGRVGPAEALGARPRRRGPDVGLGHRDDPAPQPLHVVAVDARGAGDQAARGRSRGARRCGAPRPRGPASARTSAPGRAGVVEVDVGEQHRARALVAQGGEHVLHGGLGPRVDEEAVDLVGADGVRGALEVRVDLAVGRSCSGARPITRSWKDVPSSAAPGAGVHRRRPPGRGGGGRRPPTPRRRRRPPRASRRRRPPRPSASRNGSPARPRGDRRARAVVEQEPRAPARGRAGARTRRDLGQVVVGLAARAGA